MATPDCNEMLITTTAAAANTTIICMNGHDRGFDKRRMSLYFERAAAEATSGHANVTLAETVSEPQKTIDHHHYILNVHGRLGVGRHWHW